MDGERGIIFSWVLTSVHLAALTPYHKAGWLLNDRNWLLTVLEAGNPKLRCQHGPRLARPLLLLHGWPFPCALTSLEALVWGTDPICEGCTLTTEAPPSHHFLTSSLRVKIPTYEFGGHIHLDHSRTCLGTLAGENTRKAVGRRQSHATGELTPWTLLTVKSSGAPGAVSVEKAQRPKQGRQSGDAARNVQKEWPPSFLLYVAA